MALPELRLKKGRERSVYHRHPWLFSGAVAHMDACQPGDDIVILEHDGTPIAHAFGYPNAEICARIYDFIPLSEPNEDFWKNRLKMAFQQRQSMFDFSITNGYRLLHAEGDQMPGLVADIYANTAVVQALHPGMTRLLPLIVQTLTEMGIPHIYLKQKNATRFAEGIFLEDQWLTESNSQPLEIIENGLKFWVNMESGQKTGFFLDQRENRQLLRTMCQGKRVLNAFSYTGGFSVYAGAGNAQAITSVDISSDAIETCSQNMALNHFSEIHHPVVADCFQFLNEMEPCQYDVIVLDPPAFAKSARSVSNATRGYKEINLSAIRKLPPGGLLFTFSCSRNIDRDLFRKIVFGAAADARRHVQILYQLTQPPDHPVSIFHPEGEYLKGLVLKVF